MSQNTKSILIFRLGSVGDTVVALPGFRLIQKAFPSAKKTVITNIPVNHQACALESVLENTGLVDAYIEYPSKSNLLRKCFQLRKIIRDNQYDLFIYFHQSRNLLQAWRDYFFFKLCGVKKIMGLSLMRHGFQYRYLQKKKLYQSEHVRLVEQLRALGEINWHDPNIIALHLTESEKKSALQKIPDTMLQMPLIVCSIGTKLPMKDWGQENWKKMLTKLSQDYSDCGLIFIGVASEYARSEELLRCWRGATLNLCGKLSVRESAAVLSLAKLFIGHDSGPMHLASAVNTPCVAIFSRHAGPGCWYPFGNQHHVLYPKGDTIFSISVEDVVHEIKSELSYAKTI